MTRISPQRAWLRLGFVIALAVLTASGGGLAAGGSQKDDRHRRLDARLRLLVDQGDDQPQRVIIRVRKGSLDALKTALSEHGDQLVAEHEGIDAVTAVVHAEDLPSLAATNSVVSVSTDAVVRAHGLLGGLLGVVGGLVGTVTQVVTDVVGTVLGIGGGILDPAEMTGDAVPPRVLRDTLGLNTAWSGRGVVVAVIDSGLEMSPEFEGRVLKFYDFTEGRTLQTTPFDDYGHGTHVAGTIGGSGAQSNNRDYRGLAPNVKFVVLKALDKSGAGYTSDVIRAVDFAIANRAKLGIDIINLSLGHPIYEPAATDPLVQAVERATRAGLIVVAAAGNLGKNPETGLTGYAGITSPGNAPSAITIGALQTGTTVTRGDDRIPDYSSAGPTWYDALVKPDLIAPGHNIVAAAAKRGALYKNYPHLKAADADYMKLSGTSMATAVTSGVIALMLEAQANTQGDDALPLTPNAVKGALQYSAIEVRNDLGIEYDPLRQGAGGLNGRGAIELGRAIDGSAAPGAPWLNPSPNPWTVIGGETLLWKQAIIWGSAIVWGSTIPVNHPAWGSAIIWGSQDVWNNAIIWGSTDIVWTDSHAWSSAIIWGSDSIGRDNGSAIIWGSTGGTAESTVWKNLQEN